jgi:hypothetical protein
MVQPIQDSLARRKQLWIHRFFLLVLLTVICVIGDLAEVYAQSCSCTFTAASNGAWASITWNKSGTCGSNTLPGPSDCVTIPNNRSVTLSTGIINIRGLTINGGSLSVSGSTTRLFIGPAGNATNIAFALDGGGILSITNSAIVSITGNWWNGNNGNIVTSGSSQGYFEVSGCVSVGGNRSVGQAPANNCNLNDGVLAAGLTYCVRCSTCTPNTSGFTNGAIQNTPTSCTAINTLLPITLVSFEAFVQQQEGSGEPYVALRWTTAREIDNDFFTIERSADGENFTEIQRIPGAGNSDAVISYGTTDNAPLHGISYYRLKQTDFDGTFTYSKIVSVQVNLTLASRLSVYPNPNSGSRFFLNMQSEEVKSLAIYDLSGRLQEFCTNFELTSQGLQPVTATRLSKGSYLVKVLFADGQTAIRKLMVQ